MEEERIALFLDFENLAIGARDSLNGAKLEFKPIADALAERGRVVVRRAYADWSPFDEERRSLTRHHVELIEIPQRMGASRKNAADIKMAVDALEFAFERAYLTTFVLGTGDSDFTPLVHKLRELNRRVIGVGIRGSTSPLLASACDEFLFYDALEGVDAAPTRQRRRRPRRGEEEAPVVEPVAEESGGDVDELAKTVAQTLAGLQRSSGGEVLASTLKRALLRKDPTFSEAEYGFRAFGELLRYLEQRKVVSLTEGIAKGDPEVGFPEEQRAEGDAFTLLRDTVVALEKSDGERPQLSGLKNELRKRRPGFSEKTLGYGGFLQFCKAAQTRGLIELEFDDETGDYKVHALD